MLYAVQMLILLTFARSIVSTHLPCHKVQHKSTIFALLNFAATFESMQPTTASVTTKRPKPTALGVKKPGGLPDACCINSPYNTTFKMCCFGNVIDIKQKRCCLSGSPVPMEASCGCNPKSGWIQGKIGDIKSLEIKYGTLVELLDTAKNRLQPIVQREETMVEELDARINDLYNRFLKKINISRNEDPEEINNIINLILFRHSFEEEPTVPSEIVLKKSEEHYMSQQLKLMLEEISYNLMMDEKFLSYLFASGRKKLQTLRDEDKEQLQELVHMRVEAISPSTYVEIDRIIIRRAILSRQLNRINANLAILRTRQAALVRLLAIAKTEHDLLLMTLLFLEEAHDGIRHLENIAREEDEEINEYEEDYILEKETLTTTKPRFPTTNTPAPVTLDSSQIGAEPLNDVEYNEGARDLSPNELEYLQAYGNYYYTVYGTSQEYENEVSNIEPGCNVSILTQFTDALSYRLELLVVDVTRILNVNQTVNTVEELAEFDLQQFETTKSEIAFNTKSKPPNDFELQSNLKFAEIEELVNRLPSF